MTRSASESGGKAGQALGDLVLLLSRVLAGSSPESAHAVPRLHALLSAATSAGHPVTLILRPAEGKEAEEVLAEGEGQPPRRLREIMGRGVAEGCGQGLARLLARLGLAALTLEPGMDEEELGAAAGILAGAGGDEPAALSSSLRAAGVRHLSLLPSREVVGAGRDLPWPFRVVLSRLRSRLSRLPPLPPAEAQSARRGPLLDAIRSAGSEPSAYALLLNLGLAAPPALPADEAENEFLALLDPDSLLALVPPFIADASGRAPRFRGAVPPETFDRLTGKIVFRLGQLARPEGPSLLEAMFDAGLLAMESLPPAVQERVITARLARDYLDRADSYLASLSSAPDGDSYRTRARATSRVVPYLLEKGHFGEAAALAELFGVHARGEDERGRAAREALGWMIEGGTMEEALRGFLLSGSKEARAALGRVLAVFGDRAVPYLGRVLRESDDPWKVKQAGELLAAGGGGSTLALIEALEDPALPAPATATLFRVLGSLDDEDLAPLASRAALARVHDGHGEVRRMALRALCLLSPAGHYDLFLHALKDPFPDARLEAIRGLGLCGDPRGLQHLRDLVARGEKHRSEEEWGAAAQALDALGHAHGAMPGEREGILAFLLEESERLYPAPSLKALARTLAGGGRPPSLVLQGLAHALARTGSAEARPLLERMAKDSDAALASRAVQLLHQRRG